MPPPLPMGIGTVFEVAIRIVRRHAAALFTLSLLLIGPGALVVAATGVRFNEVGLDVLPLDPEGVPVLAAPLLTAAEIERVGGAAIALLLANAFAGVLSAVAALGFSAIAGADHQGLPMDLSGALRASLGRALTAIGVVVLTSLLTIAIIVLGVALILLALNILTTGPVQEGGPGVFLALVIGVATAVTVVYLTMRWAVAFPVAVLEDQGVRGALTRSWQLTGENVWRTLAVVAGATLATVVLTALLANVLTIVLVDLLAEPLGLEPRIGETVVAALAAVIVAPFATVVAAVLYFDLRARREDW